MGDGRLSQTRGVDANPKLLQNCTKGLLLGAGLIGNTLNGGLYDLGIAGISSREGGVGTLDADGLEVLVELVNEGNSGGDVEAADVRIRDVIKVLDEGTERVAVGSNQNLLPPQSKAE